MADDIIAREVVKVSPDTKGFKASLDEQVKKAVAGINAKLSVKLVADKTGFKASVTKALGEVKGTATFKVRLVADSTGFAASARAQLARVNNPTLKVKLVADGTSVAGAAKAAAASKGALKKADQEAARSVQKLAADEDRAYEKISRSARKSADEQQRATRQTASAAQQALKDALSGPKLISLGGQGVRPLNLLYAAAAALAPVMIEVGASAIQAGTSIAALGSAAVGTGLLIGGLTIAFKGLSDLLALRKTVQAQTAQQDANNTQTQLTNANAVLDAQAAQIKAERDLHEARVQAARDLTDLKQKIADLQNQQKDDVLSVADAQQNRTQVYQNYFATALDRRKADQAVADAKQKQSDTTLSLKETRQDYATAQSKGIGGADAVINAQNALRQSTERLAQAQSTAAAGVSKVSSAQANLNAQLAKVSPALRDMYNFIDTHEGTWQRLQNTIQQGVLPGFTTFLREVTDAPKGKQSTLDFFAKQAADLGAILGKNVAAFGKFTTTPLFRKDFGEIQKNNSASLKILGKAAQALQKPLLQIVTAASPLLTIFSTDFGKLADWIATKVDKAAKSGSLAKWFHDAGVEAQKWIQIGRNISVLLGNIFKTALPGGNSLVDRFETFTAQLATWSGTNSGQTQLKDFFDFFKNLPYGDITKFLAQATVFVGAIKAFTMLTAKPINLVFAAIAAVAASNPGAVADLLNHVNNVLVTTVGYLVAHPTEAATLLGILGAMRVAKSVGIDIKLPAVDSLKKALISRFSVLDKFIGGGASTATMEVKAGVVNVYGTEVNAVPGATPAAAGTTAGEAAGGVAGLGAASIAAIAASIVGTVIGVVTQFRNGQNGQGVLAPLSSVKNNPNPLANPAGFAGSALLTIPGGLQISALANALGALNKNGGVQHWFTETLPNSLNLGIGQGGWSGLGHNLGKWFSTTLPAVISKSETKFLHVGETLIAMVWNGFRAQWTSLSDTVTRWVDEHINNPLVAVFAGIGISLRDAFVTPWAQLVPKLADQVKTAFNWLNTHLIRPLNVLLTAVFIDPIKDLVAPASAAASPTGGLGNAAGNALASAVVSKADGGPIDGYSPHSRADNIHAMLTAGEYVQPVDVVEHYGTEFMDAVRRKEIPRYAGGGAVAGLTKNSLPAEIAAGALSKAGSLKTMAKTIASHVLSAVSGIYGAITGGTASGSAQVAETAEATARGMGATDKQLLALIEAGLVESGLRNLNYGDRDSVGFLQQRPSQGWGTVAQIMDVAYATRSFISRAMRADSSNLSAGELAQAVQRSAYPARYDQRQADAVAVLNRSAPYLSGYGSQAGSPGFTGPIFGAWPSSAASVHGHDSGIWRKIINLVPARLNPGRYGTLYNNRRTDNGGWSWHASGRAVDFMGANQDTLAQWFEARKPAVLELIHRSKTADYGVQRGHDHNMGHEYGLHTNHLHVAMAGGGQVPGSYVPYRKYDAGGGLPPGYTLAFNGTGRTETVRTARQEAALGGPIRLDRRDLRLMATYVAQAASPQFHMDGRKVAEAVNNYSYLPAGV